MLNGGHAPEENSSGWASIRDKKDMFLEVNWHSKRASAFQDVDTNFMPVLSDSSLEEDSENPAFQLSPLCQELLDLIPDLGFMNKK